MEISRINPQCCSISSGKENLIQPKITVVLNVYKRSENLERQLTAVREQSIKPLEILIWENGVGTTPEEFRTDLIIARSTKNFGVWARFAFALNAKGEFVCMLDDDTIPGSNWLENCYKTMLIRPGLLGTRGIVFENKLSYSMHRDVGVHAPNEHIEEVDIVGHSWFFKKEWLGYYWSEFANKFDEDVAGEDIHFSYILQKHLNLPTLVPPHPTTDLSLWGSNPVLAKELGAGAESISQNKDSLMRFERALQHYRKLGFQTMNERSGEKSRYPKFAYFLIQKFPSLMHRMARIRSKLK